MSLEKMIAIGLLVAGALGLAYGGFSYTRETHEADLGPLSVSERQRLCQRAGLGELWCAAGGRCASAAPQELKAGAVLQSVITLRGDSRRVCACQSVSAFTSRRAP